MKKILYITIALSMLLGYSCSDDDNGKGGTPSSAVLELTAESGYGDIILQWKNPADDNLLYVDINFTDSKGISRSRKITKYKVDKETGYTRDTISGFANTENYVFTLTTCGQQGNRGPSVEITHKADEPIFNLVLNTIKVESDFGGAKISWENEFEKNATIIIKYIDPKTSGLTTALLPANKTGYGFVSDLPPLETILSISVEDVGLNSSEDKSFTLTPMEEVELSKDKWSIPGYTKDNGDPQIGYSSQQTSGEGTYPGGHIVAIIDGSASTYWHARYSGDGSSYPHFVIIDLGKEVTVSRVGIQRRPGDKRGQKGHQFLTCTEANGTDLTNPAVWEDQGSYEFDSTKDDKQNARLENNPVARYLKIYIGPEFKGENSYAMIAEVYISGQE